LVSAYTPTAAMKKKVIVKRLMQKISVLLIFQLLS